MTEYLLYVIFGLLALIPLKMIYDYIYDITHMNPLNGEQIEELASLIDVIPITSPLPLAKGPPLFPELIAASVCNVLTTIGVLVLPSVSLSQVRRSSSILSLSWHVGKELPCRMKNLRHRPISGSWPMVGQPEELHGNSLIIY